MKRFILFFSLIIMCATLNAQDRVNRPKLQYLTQGAKLTNFKGWGYDSKIGEWLGYTNVILNDKKDYDYMSTIPTCIKSDISNNIISLQFKTINYCGTNYYVLVWELWRGYYKYPNIHTDWVEYRTKRFLVFTEGQMEKLRNVNNKIYNFKVICFERGKYDNHMSEVDVIYNNLSKPKNEYSYGGISYSYFTIYKSTDGKIRFRYNFCDNGVEDIKNGYFEITYEYFKKLINIQFPKQ